jgi:hypothetical protein
MDSLSDLVPTFALRPRIQHSFKEPKPFNCASNQLTALHKIEGEIDVDSFTQNSSIELLTDYFKQTKVCSIQCTKEATESLKQHGKDFLLFGKAASKTQKLFLSTKNKYT